MGRSKPAPLRRTGARTNGRRLAGVPVVAVFENVVTGAAAVIGAAATVEQVAAGAAEQRVVALLAEDTIVALARQYDVVSGAGADDVVAAKAEDQVVAAFGYDDIGPVRSEDNVWTFCPDPGRRLAVASRGGALRSGRGPARWRGRRRGGGNESRRWRSAGCCRGRPRGGGCRISDGCRRGGWREIGSGRRSG